MKVNHTTPKKKLIFISHSTADEKIIKGKNGFEDILISSNYNLFFSSNPKHSVNHGKSLFQQIDENLKECHFFIAFITENYYRSYYCLYEMSIARYNNKKIIPIFSSISTKDKSHELLNSDVITIIASQSDKENSKAAELLCRSLNIKLENNVIHIFQNLLKRLSGPNKSKKPFIGMSKEEYLSILGYCEKNGITKFGTGQIYEDQEIQNHIIGAKQVYIIAITCSSLFKKLKDYAIPYALQNGTTFNVIISDKNSSFCKDVAKAESFNTPSNDIILSMNEKRLNNEFESTHLFLNEAYEAALQNSSHHTNKSLGTITCYNSRTLLRQTIVLTIDKHNSAWGWMTMTMSPSKTANNPSIGFSCENINDTTTLANFFLSHFKCLISVAGNEKHVINGRTLATPFSEQKPFE